MALKNQSILSANPKSIVNNNYINALYQEKFGRNATQAELNRFAGYTVKDASNLILGKTDSPFSGTSSGMSKNQLTVDQEAQLQSLLSEVDSSDFSDTEKGVLKSVLSQDFSSGQAIPSMEDLSTMVSDAYKNAEESLSPYYEKVKYQDLEDLKTKLGDIRTGSSIYAEGEKYSYNELLRKTKDDLAARGLATSGESRRVLGDESSIGGAGVEGTLAEERRNDWQSYINELETKTRDLGTEAERKYGSADISSVQSDFGGIYNPYDLSSGNIKYQSNRYTPSYLAKKTGETGYIRSGDTKAEGEYAGTYLGSSYLDRKAAIEKAAAENLSKKAAWKY